MGITPGVLHMNEGHSGFAILEAIRDRMQSEGIGFDHAARRVSRTSVFTTHTPVPAGHDRFHLELMEEHLGPMREALGISREKLMELGRENPGDPADRQRSLSRHDRGRLGLSVRLRLGWRNDERG